MVKAGTKNFISISQGVKEIKNNDSMVCISSTTDDFITVLETYREALTNGTSDMNTLDESLGSAIHTFQDDTLKYEKSVNKSLKSLSTKIDKGIEWELDMIYEYQNINDDFDLMVRAIVMDLLYQGKFEEVNILAVSSNSKSTNMNDLDVLIKHFQSLRGMIKMLYEEDYTPVFQWVHENENEIFKLSEIKSDLTSLIYYQALELKKDRSQQPPPNGNIILKIQNNKDSRLLLRIKDYSESLKPLDKSSLFTHSTPTLDKFDKNAFKDKVNSELIRLFNLLSKDVQNLQQESPLYQCLLAGHFALGPLVKANLTSRRKSSLSLGTPGLGSGSTDTSAASRRRSTSTSVNEMHPLINRLRGLHTHLSEADGSLSDSSKGLPSTAVFDSILDNTVDELPKEIELPKWMSYHTIFICPVSIEQTTDTNRPHVLACRHFVSNKTLNALSKSMNDEIKCPYCPKRGSWRDAHEVKFIAL